MIILDVMSRCFGSINQAVRHKNVRPKESMSEPKRILHPVPDVVPEAAPESRDTSDRSPTVIAFGLVAVISMLFGFAIGLFF